MTPLAPLLCYVGCLADFTPAPGHQADGIQMLEVFPVEAESRPARGLIAFMDEEAGPADEHRATEGEMFGILPYPHDVAMKMYANSHVWNFM